MAGGRAGEKVEASTMVAANSPRLLSEVETFMTPMCYVPSKRVVCGKKEDQGLE